MSNDNRLVKAKEVEEIFNYEVSVADKDPLDAFDSAIENAATVDAAEVVHCKVCKHRVDAYDSTKFLCKRKMLGLVRPDDFCSFAEREDNESAASY